MAPISIIERRAGYDRSEGIAAAKTRTATKDSLGKHIFDGFMGGAVVRICGRTDCQYDFGAGKSFLQRWRFS